jgi:hypothetical protein
VSKYEGNKYKINKTLSLFLLHPIIPQREVRLEKAPRHSWLPFVTAQWFFGIRELIVENIPIQ